MGQTSLGQALEALKENGQGACGAPAQGKAPRDGGTGAGLGGQLVLECGAEAGFELGVGIWGLDSGTRVKVGAKDEAAI